jgi:hypothetical protein
MREIAEVKMLSPDFREKKNRSIPMGELPR